MYGFLFTRRWIGFGAMMVLAAAVMVGLGCWQLSRYHQRATVNAHIDAASRAAPVPLDRVLDAGQPAPASAAWTRVSVTGRYDVAHQILARDRTVDSGVGFEVLTPMVLGDGSAVLVDRGWLPPAPDSVTAPARIPAVPDGTVTVSGRLHLPESRADRPIQVDGGTQVRRISPVLLAGTLPYRLYDGYVLLDSGAPGGDPSFSAIPADHQNALMNAGYVVQWWAFALLTLIGFGWTARREARGPDDGFDLAELDDDYRMAHG
ncbi:MAG TPA: SURF1 family protein [Rugosimonospora sp.]|nr:SURF1 family protein [Rugosimonospora sp.]